MQTLIERLTERANEEAEKARAWHFSPRHSTRAEAKDAEAKAASDAVVHLTVAEVRTLLALIEDARKSANAALTNLEGLATSEFERGGDKPAREALAGLIVRIAKATQ